MRQFAVPFAGLMMIATSAAAQTKAEFARPEMVGLSTERLGRLDAAMQDDVDARRKAGTVVLVARHGRIAHLKAIGFSDIESGKRMAPDAVFRMNSETKPMISVGLLMLYEQGKFALGDPLEKYIPAFARLKVAMVDPDGKVTLRAPARKPTILDALRHTSGFPGSQNLPAWKGPVEKQWLASADRLRGDLAAHMEVMADLPMVADPGTQWRYGPEHDIQGRLIEIFSGMPLDVYMRERVFKPLKMTDTGYAVTPSMMARYTTLYGPDGKGGLKPVDTPADSAYIKAAHQPMGSGGTSSTAYDQFRFGQMLLNGGELDGVRLLSRKTVEMMLSDQLPAEIKDVRMGPDSVWPGLRYGLGIGVMGNVVAGERPSSVGAAAWPGISTTEMVVDPAEDMVIVVLTQYRPGQTGWLQRVETLAYQALADAPAWKKGR